MFPVLFKNKIPFVYVRKKCSFHSEFRKPQDNITLNLKRSNRWIKCKDRLLEVVKSCGRKSLKGTEFGGMTSALERDIGTVTLLAEH